MDDSPDPEPAVGRAGLGAVTCEDSIYLIGGHTGRSPLRSAARFDPEGEGEWTALPAMQARRSYLAVTAHDRKIYALGGGADNRVVNTIEVYDTEKSAWSLWFSMPPMQSKRMQHAAVTAEGKLFVVGGFDGTRDMATCERFDPVRNQWNWVDNMAVRRSYLAMAVAEGQIFAIGGQDRLQTDARAHSSVEAFNLYSELWRPCPPLQACRIAAAAATLENRAGEAVIYVTGGSDGEEVLASVEFYVANGERGGWASAPPMSSPRLSHAAVVFRNKLYVIGGSDGQSPLDTFEVFDPEEGIWSPPERMGQLPALAKDVSQATKEDPTTSLHS